MERNTIRNVDECYGSDDSHVPPSSDNLSYSVSSSYHTSDSRYRDEHTMKVALANVRNQYRSNLDCYGLTESYYDETSGICDLMLLDVGRWEKYQIVFYKATGLLEWPQSMPKSVAEQFIYDRMLIDTYEKATSGGR